MRLVDFLIQVLRAHSSTLQRLAALLSEEVLMELLEQAGDEDEGSKRNESEELAQTVHYWQPPVQSKFQSSAYSELETAVQEMKLPAVLTFYLWAYPPYRALIESPIDLNATLRHGNEENDFAVSLVDLTVREATAWIKSLPLPPSISRQAEAAAEVPWRRFRMDVLKQIGKRPFGAV